MFCSKRMASILMQCTYVICYFQITSSLCELHLAISVLDSICCCNYLLNCITIFNLFSLYSLLNVKTLSRKKARSSYNHFTFSRMKIAPRPFDTTLLVDGCFSNHLKRGLFGMVAFSCLFCW